MKKAMNMLVIGFFFILMFSVYSLLPLSQLTDGLGNSISLKFDTPDEMVNYTFTRNFSMTSRLYYVDLVNVYLTEPIVFPRWARPVEPEGGLIYPGTFWGLPIIFGTIGKAAGTAVIPFLTPLFALGCVGLMYGIARRALPEKDAARWSAVVLALFPVFVYYASRTMFHTILFVFFLLLGSWCYLETFATGNNQTSSGTINGNAASMIRDSKSVILYYVSSVSFGLALFVRFADVILTLLTIAALMAWKRADGKRIFLFCCVLIVSLVPIFILNHIAYGNAFDFGHNGGNVVEAADGVISNGSMVEKVVSLVLPFGFHPRVMLRVVLNALVKSYWWFWILAAAGYWILIKRYWNIGRRTLLIVSLSYLLSSVYVIAFYGSWSFSDSVVLNSYPISSSYYRYFLTLFIMAVPFVGYLFAILFAWLKHHVSRITYHGSWIGSIGFLIFVTFHYAYLDDEGLLHVRRQALAYRQITLEAKRMTNQEDIILVRRGEDKMVYPDRYHVVNVDYIPRETVIRVLKPFKGVVWEIRNGKFERVQ